MALEAGASTTCLIVAGVLAASLANVITVNAGFATERTIAGELRLPASRYDLERAPAFLRALKQAAESIPGVVSVGISDRVPLKGEGGNSPLAPEGTTLPRLQRPMASLQLADASYFRALDIPLVEGRLFEESDQRRTPVAVVAASAARIWPGQRVIGKRFRIGSVRTRRFQMGIALLFAMTALVLTALGIYSTLASATRQRTREIAVRIALGAKPGEIRWMILAQALTPVGAGIAAGLVLVWPLRPLLRGLLFGVSPTDPRVFAVTTLVLGSVAVIAAYIPGRRATRVNPSVAMRAE